MPNPSVPENQRLASLDNTGQLFSLPEERFNRIVRLSSHIFGTPIAFISLVSKDTVWFKASVGLDSGFDRAPRDIAFCGQVIEQDGMLIIEDTLLDQRFSSNPMVTGSPHIRFYAGYPIHTEDGSAVGTLCVLDSQPRSLAPGQLQCLADLAAMAEDELGVQKALKAKNEALQKSHDDLSLAVARMREAFQAAGEQESLATLGSMSASFTHEISTPLGNSLLVAGHFERAASELSAFSLDGFIKRSDLTRISKSLADGSRILHSNLSAAAEITRAFKLVSSDQIGKPWRRFNLSEVVFGALKALSPSLIAAHLEPDISGIDPRIEIIGPPGPIEQIVANMANNAILHAYDPGLGGPLSIDATFAQDNMFTLRFSDRGKGFPPGSATRLFDAFYSTRKQAGGTGLGLHIVHQIATGAYQGSARAENRLGGGAVFTFLLSLCPCKPTSTDRLPAQTPLSPTA